MPPKLNELAFSKEALLKCRGFDEKFIAGSTKLKLSSIVPSTLQKKLPDVEGAKDKVLRYTGLSVLYNLSRKLPFVCAYNIDGNVKANQRPRPSFKRDPRIKENFQLDYGFYGLKKLKTEFEIGHMASNNEMGRGKEGPLRAFQTFHFTNSAPQAKALNAGLWRGLESYIIKEAGKLNGNKKISVFTGPVLENSDPPYVRLTSFKVPQLFYKVVVFQVPGGTYSSAFIISHEAKLLELKLLVVPKKRKTRAIVPEAFQTFPYRKVFQVNISYLEYLTGLKFSWKGVTPVRVPRQIKLLQKIKGIKNAADAKRIVRSGIVPKANLSTADVTEAELKNNNFTLNLIMPPAR
jgi:DNA/RNA endonuclease G (NUC1)